jgi:hypothetical protein
VALSAVRADGQARPGSPYVIAGLALPRESTPCYCGGPYVPAPGGQTIGWVVGGGVFLTRLIAVDLDLSRTGLMTEAGSARGVPFNEERRDRFLDIGVRWHLPAGARVAFEPLTGVVLTQRDAWFQTGSYIGGTSPAQYALGARQEHSVTDTWRAAFGIDVRIGTPRVAFVPSFRMYDTGASRARYTPTSSEREIDSTFPGGYPRWTVRPGVSIRIDF